MLSFSTKSFSLLQDMNVEIYNPRNTQAVELYFRGEKMAKVMGSLAAVKPSGALPWFLEKVCTKDRGTVSCVKVDDFVFQTTFKGRVFMTHATKAIYRWLLPTLEDGQSDELHRSSCQTIRGTLAS